MNQESTMTEECPSQLTANAAICPLAMPTYLPPEASIDDLKEFFTQFVERDLPELTNVSIGQIVMLLSMQPKNSSFYKKCNVITDLFVRGMLDKRAEMLKADRQQACTA